METGTMPDGRDRVFAKRFLVAFVAAIVLVVAFNFAVDPYFCYRKSALMAFSSFDQTASPTWKYGLAKQNRGYDAIWVGSSLSSHLYIHHLQYLNEKFGINCCAGIQASGRPNIYETFINLFLKHNKPKYVFYETYINHWSFELEGIEFDEEFVPRYIKTDSVLDDWEYLLGRKITEESAFVVLGALENRVNGFLRDKFGLEKEEPAAKTEDIMPADVHYSTRTMAKARTIYSNRAYWSFNSKVAAKAPRDGLATIDKHIAPLIEANPDTEFVFIVPPVGVITKAIFYNGGLLEAYLDVARAVFTKLLSYPNTRIIACDLDFEYNTNTDNYMDDGHYEPSGGKLMVDCIAEGKYEITLENLEQRLQEYRAMAQTFVWPFLKPGFFSYQVADLQTQLAALGYDVEVSARYDKATEDAVRDFQEKNGIEPDGIAFSDTIQRLAELQPKSQE